MTDEQITKALECDTHSNCEECPCWHEFCEPNNVTAKDVLDLINRQKAEIKNLSVDLNKKVAEIERFKKIETTINTFWSELKKLIMAKGKETPTLEELLEHMENLKSEAIKEFAERLIIKMVHELSVLAYRDARDVVDNLVKEMTEPSLLDKKFGSDAE